MNNEDTLDAAIARLLAADRDYKEFCKNSPETRNAIEGLKLEPLYQEAK